MLGKSLLFCFIFYFIFPQTGQLALCSKILLLLIGGYLSASNLVKSGYFVFFNVFHDVFFVDLYLLGFSSSSSFFQLNQEFTKWVSFSHANELVQVYRYLQENQIYTSSSCLLAWILWLVVLYYFSSEFLRGFYSIVVCKWKRWTFKLFSCSVISSFLCSSPIYHVCRW